MSNESSQRRPRRGSSLDRALFTTGGGSSSSSALVLPAETPVLSTGSRRHRAHREEAGFDYHSSGSAAAAAAAADVKAPAGNNRSRSHSRSFDGDIERPRSRTTTSTIGGGINNHKSSPTSRSGGNILVSSQGGLSGQGESTRLQRRQRRRQPEDDDSPVTSRSLQESEKRLGFDSTEQQQQQGSPSESGKSKRVQSTSMRYHSFDSEEGNRLSHRHSDNNISSRVSPRSGVRRSHREHGEARDIVAAGARSLDDGDDEDKLPRGRHSYRLSGEATREKSRSSVSSSPLSETHRRHRRDDPPSPSMTPPAVSAAAVVTGEGYGGITNGRRNRDEGGRIARASSGMIAVTGGSPHDSAESIEDRHGGREHRTRYDRIDASRKSRDPITVEPEKSESGRGDALVGRLVRDHHHHRPYQGSEGHGEAHGRRGFEESDRRHVVERGRPSRHDHEPPRSVRSGETRYHSSSNTSSIRHHRSSRSPDSIIGESFENKHGDACGRTRAVGSTSHEDHKHSRSKNREGSPSQSITSNSRQSHREHQSVLEPSWGAISSGIEGGYSFHRDSHNRDDHSSTPRSRSRSRSPDRLDVAEGSPARATATTRARTSSANGGDDERHCSPGGRFANSPCSNSPSREDTKRSSGTRGSPDARRRDHCDDHDDRVDNSIIRSKCGNSSSSSHHHGYRAGEEEDNSVIGKTRTRTSRERQKNASEGEEGARYSDGLYTRGGHDNNSKSKNSRSSTGDSSSDIRRQQRDRSAVTKEDGRRSRHYRLIEDREERDKRASSHRCSTSAHSSDSPERRSRHRDRSSQDEPSHHGRSGERHRVSRTPSPVETDREVLRSASQGATTAAGDEEGRYRQQHHESNHRRGKDRDDHRLRHASPSPLGRDTDVDYRITGLHDRADHRRDQQEGRNRRHSPSPLSSSPLSPPLGHLAHRHRRHDTSSSPGRRDSPGRSEEHAEIDRERQRHRQQQDRHQQHGGSGSNSPMNHRLSSCYSSLRVDTNMGREESIASSLGRRDLGDGGVKANGDHRVRFDFDDAAYYHTAAASPVSHGTSASFGEGTGISKYTRLHLACLNGSVTRTKRELYLGADVNAPAPGDENGASPLQLACSSGRNSLVQLLLSESADPSLRNRRGASALHYAAAAGHETVVATLLQTTDCAADTNLVDARGRTPLHDACDGGTPSPSDGTGIINNKGDRDHHRERNRVAVARLLVNAGADPGARTLASPGGELEILPCSGRVGSDAARSAKGQRAGLTPLHLACRSGRAELADYLIRAGASVSAKDGEGCFPGDLFEPWVSSLERRAVREVFRPAPEKERARELRATVARLTEKTRAAEEQGVALLEQTQSLEDRLRQHEAREADRKRQTVLLEEELARQRATVDGSAPRQSEFRKETSELMRETRRLGRGVHDPAEASPRLREEVVTLSRPVEAARFEQGVVTDLSERRDACESRVEIRLAELDARMGRIERQRPCVTSSHSPSKSLSCSSPGQVEALTAKVGLLVGGQGTTLRRLDDLAADVSCAVRSIKQSEAASSAKLDLQAHELGALVERRVSQLRSEVDAQLARAWQLVGRGTALIGYQSKEGGEGVALTAGVSSLLEAGGGGTISSVKVLTDMVLATQLKIGELDCEVSKCKEKVKSWERTVSGAVEPAALKYPPPTSIPSPTTTRHTPPPHQHCPSRHHRLPGKIPRFFAVERRSARGDMYSAADATEKSDDDGESCNSPAFRRKFREVESVEW